MLPAGYSRKALQVVNGIASATTCRRGGAERRQSNVERCLEENVTHQYDGIRSWHLRYVCNRPVIFYTHTVLLCGNLRNVALSA